MGKKVFITYGNSGYYNSLKRIRKEAEDTRLFDEIIIRTDKDLPSDLLNHPLMQYTRGGGYWVWKPYVILTALVECSDDDILVYSDCGNQVFHDKEWDKYWTILKRKNGIFFRYGALAKQRTRKNLLMQFNEPRFLRELYQIQGGFLILKRDAAPVIEKWLELMLLHPEFVVDVPEQERALEDPCFIEHRHDQSVLSCLVYSHERSLKLKVLWQHSEWLDRFGQAIYNARISDDTVRSSFRYESLPRLLVRRFIINPFRSIRSFFFQHIAS